MWKIWKFIEVVWVHAATIGDRARTRVDIEEVVPVREAELTLEVEVGRSFGDLRVVKRERSGKELQRRNCSAMDESGDFKFTSREKLLELGRMMDLSGSELEEFVAEQQEYEQ